MFQGWRDVEKQHVFYVLTQLKQLFANKNNWIDWPLATDANGQIIEATDSKATKWNLMGACLKIATEKYNAPLVQFIDCATREFLFDLSDDNLIGKMLPYDDEYALICLGHEFLIKDK